MAKGQMRSNREKKKPKKVVLEKSKVAATAASAQSAFLQPPINRSKSYRKQR